MGDDRADIGITGLLRRFEHEAFLAGYAPAPARAAIPLRASEHGILFFAGVGGNESEQTLGLVVGLEIVTLMGIHLARLL